MQRSKPPGLYDLSCRHSKVTARHPGEVCSPCSGESGKRKGFADKREPGSKQPTITQQKSSSGNPAAGAHQTTRLLPARPPLHPSAGAAPEPSASSLPPRSPPATLPLGSRPLFLPGGVSSPSLSRSGAPWGAHPSHGHPGGGPACAPSSHGGTCCILLLRTWPKPSRRRRWALPARLARRHRHRRPSHELALAPRWQGQDLRRTGRGPAGRRGRTGLHRRRPPPTRPDAASGALGAPYPVERIPRD